MSEFENKKTQKDGVYYSRYIASWLNQTMPYNPFPDEKFEEWLRQRGLTEDEIIDIRLMGMTGKFELDQDIKDFLAKK